jgi:hypothetical protein
MSALTSAKNRWLSAGLIYAVLSGASLAHAHPDLDRALELTRELEREPALTAYTRALDSGTLTRAELTTLLAERALLLHGLRRQGELIADLVWLSAIEPSYVFDKRAPPELMVTFSALREQGRGPLAVQLTAQAEGSLQARAKLTGTVPAGATARIALRESGAGWSVKKSDELWQVALPGESLELYAEAVAIGGVVVARDHSPEAPLRLKVPAAATANSGQVAVDDGDSWARRHRGWLIGGAILASSAAAVVAVLWIKNDQDDERRNTSVSPMVRF